MGRVLSDINPSSSSFDHTTSSGRYHKLGDNEIHVHTCSSPYCEDTSHAHSLQHSTPGAQQRNECDGASFSLPSVKQQPNQDERIASIRDDIGRFSTPTIEVIPRVSSRWSKFMNESEVGDGGDGGDGGEEGEGEREGVQMHMLQSKVTVAKYN